MDASCAWSSEDLKLERSESVRRLRTSRRSSGGKAVSFIGIFGVQRGAAERTGYPHFMFDILKLQTLSYAEHIHQLSARR